MHTSTIIKYARISTLIGYFGLFILTILGIVSNRVYPEYPRIILIILLLMPLIFPARGLLRGKPYTHSWTSYLALFYVIVGTDLWVMGNLTFAIPYLLLTIALFGGCVFYSRHCPPSWNQPQKNRAEHKEKNS